MRSLCRVGLLVLAVGALFVPSLAASAAETSNSDIVLIREGDVVPDDLYVTALSVRVIGVIDGDLVAFAAEEVVIEGTVTGSVTVVAPTVVVSGVVEGSLRAAANDVVVSGEIAEDLIAVGVDVELEPESTIGGDVLAWLYRLSALGSIGGDLTGSQRRLDLAGTVSGDVDVAVGSLRVVDDLVVEGDLGYRSRHEAEGMDQAQVEGAIVHKTPLPPNLRVRALGLFARLLSVVFVAIATVTTVWAWPERSRAAAVKVTTGGWKSWLYGAIFFFSPALVGLLAWLLLTVAPPVASLPLLALLVPLALALIGLVLLVSLVAGAPVAIRVGNLINKRWGLFGAVIAGSALLGLLWCLPLIGWLVPAVALPLGLGAWIRSGQDQSSTAET